jgi:hypothetical protein
MAEKQLIEFALEDGTTFMDNLMRNHEEMLKWDT